MSGHKRYCKPGEPMVPGAPPRGSGEVAALASAEGGGTPRSRHQRGTRPPNRNNDRGIIPGVERRWRASENRWIYDDEPSDIEDSSDEEGGGRQEWGTGQRLRQRGDNRRGASVLHAIPSILVDLPDGADEGGDEDGGGTNSMVVAALTSTMKRKRNMTELDRKISGKGWVSWEDEELGISIDDGWLISGFRRASGTMQGYVDKHYMAPDGEICRSMKGVQRILNGSRGELSAIKWKTPVLCIMPPEPPKHLAATVLSIMAPEPPEDVAVVETEKTELDGDGDGEEARSKRVTKRIKDLELH